MNFTVPYFEEIDNRAINLHLIRSWKTRAIMFRPDGSVVIPADMLYKKNVLTIRGSFRPVTRLNVDMIEQGLKCFTETSGVTIENSVALAEISLNDPHGHDLMVSEEDLIARVRLLNSLGYSVMISDHTRYFSLRAYFRQFTKLQIGIVVGISNIRQIFDQGSYRGVEGGILEGFGKLFPDNTRLLVYPEIDQVPGNTPITPTCWCRKTCASSIGTCWRIISSSASSQAIPSYSRFSRAISSSNCRTAAGNGNRTCRAVSPKKSSKTAFSATATDPSAATLRHSPEVAL